MKVTLRAKAISFLSRREYSYKELFQKLRKYSDDNAEITLVLDSLTQNGYLSEERYLESYINSKAKKYGALKLKSHLYHLVDQDKVNEAFNNAHINEVTIIENIWQKRFANSELNFKSYAKQFRHFTNKGFSYSCIKQALKPHYLNILD